MRYSLSTISESNRRISCFWLPDWSPLCHLINLGSTTKFQGYTESWDWTGHMLYKNRTQAGKAVAAKLRAYKDCKDLIVLALPRGGVPVAFEIANQLHAPLDIFVVRKLGTPAQEELAMGAIATGGVRILNDRVIRYLNIPDRIVIKSRPEN